MEMDINVRIRALVALSKDDRVEASEVFDRPDVICLVDQLLKKVDESDRSPVAIMPRFASDQSVASFHQSGPFDAHGVPAAWAIPELEKIGRNGNHGAAN